MRSDEMKRESWAKIRATFEELVDLEPAERARRLAELEERDPELARHARELLERDGGGDLEDVPPSEVWSHLCEASTLPPGTRLGPWELGAVIASGGMGTVYRGERADAQFEKSVAIKLIKRGMDSEEILRRFRYERQVLAELDHPGIARLIDGGMSDEGQPYFVMEYVEGLPIDEWCAGREPSLQERLRLFQGICQAVSYAHRHLVVHRDLKPSNVLVTPEGEPKLLDFGVARMLDPERHGEQSRWTAEQGFFGTPSFASPEQLRGETVTTASDVYSLGVMLYRLLTGGRPYELSEVSREEAMRLVCEVEPTAPSRRAGLSTARGDRGLASRLAGDLDNIVLMAMRKEPERRYSSVEQLSEDIQRHLDGLPVLARPNTLAYRASKFFARNRALTLTGLALALSLLVGAITSTLLYTEAEDARDDAVRTLEDLRRMAATFIFDVSDEMGPLEGTVQARERIVASALTYLDELAGQEHDDPQVVYELAGAYLQLGDLQGGTIHSNLGRRADARVSYDKAAALARHLLEADPLSVGSADLLARSLYRQSDLDFLGGEDELGMERLNEALPLCPPDSGEAPVLATRSVLLERRGERLKLRGQFDAAAGDLEESLAIQEDLLERRPLAVEARRDLAVAMNKLADVRLQQGDLEDAELLCSESRALLEELLDEGVEDAESRGNYIAALNVLGTLYLQVQRPEDALEPLRLADEQAAIICRADPGNVLAKRNRAAGQQVLGMVLGRLGQHEEALEVLQEAESIMQELLELDPGSLRAQRDYAISLSTTASALTNVGRLDESHAVNLRAVEEFEALLERDPRTGEARRDLAACLSNLGGYHMSAARDDSRPIDERRAHAERAGDSFERALGELHGLDAGGRLAEIDRQYVPKLESSVRDAKALQEELESAP